MENMSERFVVSPSDLNLLGSDKNHTGSVFTD